KALEAAPAEAARQLRAVLRAAVALREQLDQRERASGLLHTNLCLHVGEGLLRGTSKVDIVRGPLLRTDVWPPGEAASGLCVTRAAAETLDEAGLVPGPGDVLIWRGPFAGP